MDVAFASTRPWTSSRRREEGSIRILNGKGGRARTVGIDPSAVAVVDRWLEVRSELGINGTYPVLCTLVGVKALLPTHAGKVKKRLSVTSMRIRFMVPPVFAVRNSEATATGWPHAGQHPPK